MGTPKKKLLPNNLFKVNLLIRKGEKVQFQVELFKWLLSSGRFIVVFVELMVIGAFVYRYKLDADLADIQDKIKEQIPYIQSLKNDELLIRQAQLRLKTISQTRQDNLVWTRAFDKVSSLTPQAITLTTVSLNRIQNSPNVSISITGQSPSNRELSAFIKALQKEPAFSGITLTNISFEGQTVFTITGNLSGIGVLSS